MENAVNDGTVLTSILQARGFTVTFLTELKATRHAILKALENLPKCETVVVALFGHGCSGIHGPAFVPVEAEYNSHCIADKVSVDSLRGFCKRSKAHGILHILDCCYGGDFTIRTRGDRPSWTRTQHEKSRIVISSAMMREKVPDGTPDGHSPFMEFLIAAMRDETFSGSAIELFVSARSRIIGSKVACLPKIGRFDGDQGGDVFI